MITRQNQHSIFGKPDRSGWFSGKVAAGIIFTLFLLFFENQSIAQVQVTGHVFAEIVEPTALTADANNNHLIFESNNDFDNDLVLAEVKLSGRDVNIDVSIQSGNLESASGATLQFEAIACPQCSTDDSYPMGSEKLFTLIGNAGDTGHKDKNSTYNGQYQVIFMYN